MKTSIKLNSASCLISNQSKQRLSLQFCFLGHFSLFLFLFQIFQNVTVCMCVCVWVCVCVCVCVCVFMYIILHLRSYDPLIGCMSPVLEHFRTLEAFVSLSLLFALLLLLLFLLIFFPPSLSFSLFLTHTHIYTLSRQLITKLFGRGEVNSARAAIYLEKLKSLVFSLSFDFTRFLPLCFCRFIFILIFILNLVFSWIIIAIFFWSYDFVLFDLEMCFVLFFFYSFFFGFVLWWTLDFLKNFPCFVIKLPTQSFSPVQEKYKLPYQIDWGRLSFLVP